MYPERGFRKILEDGRPRRVAERERLEREEAERKRADEEKREKETREKQEHSVPIVQPRMQTRSSRRASMPATMNARGGAVRTSRRASMGARLRSAPQPLPQTARSEPARSVDTDSDASVEFVQSNATGTAPTTHDFQSEHERTSQRTPSRRNRFEAKAPLTSVIAPSSANASAKSSIQSTSQGVVPVSPCEQSPQDNRHTGDTHHDEGETFGKRQLMKHDIAQHQSKSMQEKGLEPTRSNVAKLSHVPISYPSSPTPGPFATKILRSRNVEYSCPPLRSRPMVPPPQHLTCPTEGAPFALATAIANPTHQPAETRPVPPAVRSTAISAPLDSRRSGGRARRLSKRLKSSPPTPSAKQDSTSNSSQQTTQGEVEEVNDWIRIPRVSQDNAGHQEPGRVLRSRRTQNRSSPPRSPNLACRHPSFGENFLREPSPLCTTETEAVKSTREISGVHHKAPPVISVDHDDADTSKTKPAGNKIVLRSAPLRKPAEVSNASMPVAKEPRVSPVSRPSVETRSGTRRREDPHPQNLNAVKKRPRGDSNFENGSKDSVTVSRMRRRLATHRDASPRPSGKLQADEPDGEEETESSDDTEAEPHRGWEDVTADPKTLNSALSHFMAQQLGIAMLAFSGVTSAAMREISPQLGKLPLLRRLEINNNKLEELPSELRTSIQRTTFVNVSWNRLRAVPDWFCDCSELQQINLSNNQLKTFPKQIAKLRKLEVLQLNNNYIEELPPGIGQLSCLIVLNLGYNMLKRLPEDIGVNNESLAVLDISYNKTFSTGLPQNCANLKELQDLFLVGTEVYDSLRPRDRKLEAPNLAKLLAGKTLRDLAARRQESARSLALGDHQREKHNTRTEVRCLC